MSGVTLGEVVSAIEAEVDGAKTKVVGDLGLRVLDVHHDSRSVTAGSLFCCVPGSTSDGHDHALTAVAAGACALLCERRIEVDVPQIRVTSVRAAMGTAAAVVHGRPATKLRCVGVTGTNGKTTTVALIAAILKAAGGDPIVIGTLTGTRTTPEAPDLQRLLAGAVHDGKTEAVLEVSSHALVQQRVGGMRFVVAIFTNLSPDHLDFHASMADYFRAKATLFEPDRADQAVVNLDDPHGNLLFDAALIPTVGFSLADAEPIEFARASMTFHWRGLRVRLPLMGMFNVENALAAATAASRLDIDDATIVRGLEAAPQIAGRFEVIDEGQPFTVIVDFAHTPDGIRRSLETARMIAGRARVLVVFGAGGDRDPSKRPLMGDVAEQLADVVVVTSDNPRHESASAIASAIMSGMQRPQEALVELDRRAAITSTLAGATPGDVVVLAGKGHETNQVIGDTVTPFDDRAVARSALVELRELK